MAHAQQPWGGAGFGGTQQVTGLAGGGIITDPSRPDMPGFRWRTQGGFGPFSGTVWAGGGAVYLPAAGGLAVEADADLALVNIRAWWSGAPYLRLVRIVADTRTPVRTASPIPTTTPTRRNRCTNPSFEVDTTGWVAGTNTTVTAPTDPAAPVGADVGRLKATAAGAVTTTVPCLLSTELKNSVSLALRLSAAPTGALTLTAAWVNAAGTALSSSTVTIPAASLAGYVAGFARTPVLGLTPPSTAAQGTLTLAIAGMAANATVDVDAVLIEEGDSDGTYFDGDSLTGGWFGPAGLSQSTLAAALQVADPEAPLDVDVQYELTAPDQPQFRAISEPVQLSSRGRVWLSHPTIGAPVPVIVEKEPEVAAAIDRGVFKVLGRKYPVAVTAGPRRAVSGTYEVATFSFAERDALNAMLDDGSPLLLRMPANLGHGPGEWLSIADTSVGVVGHTALEHRPRHFTLPFQIVAPPALPVT